MAAVVHTAASPRAVAHDAGTYRYSLSPARAVATRTHGVTRCHHPMPCRDRSLCVEHPPVRLPSDPLTAGDRAMLEPLGRRFILGGIGGAAHLVPWRPSGCAMGRTEPRLTPPDRGGWCGGHSSRQWFCSVPLSALCSLLSALCSLTFQPSFHLRSALLCQRASALAGHAARSRRLRARRTWARGAPPCTPRSNRPGWAWTRQEMRRMG
jgi:hypothetical protein